MNIIKKIIFDGELPYFEVFKKILRFIPFFGLFIFFYPETYADFGSIGWFAILFIVFIRPLSDILPKLKILKKGVLLRKEIGIISGIFIIAQLNMIFYRSGYIYISRFL